MQTSAGRPTELRRIQTHSELGDFLRTRRDGLTPEAAGIISYGRRRVPGLRREEVAQLAGVSVTYLVRLEQGQSANASPAVLNALARALRLDSDEHAHLLALAHPQDTRKPRSSKPQPAAPGALQLVAAVADVPLMLLGRVNEILAWNPLAHRLFASHLPFDAPSRSDARPNLLRMLFLDAHARSLYRDWEAEASLAVASLRYVAAQFPDDIRIAHLVGEISMDSPEFARLWARHSVRLCTSGSKRLQHPEDGQVDLDFEILHLPAGEGQRILSLSAPPASAAEAALKLLRTGW
jgi:transcriptional regulator with XRE-family HTH domain